MKSGTVPRPLPTRAPRTLDAAPVALLLVVALGVAVAATALDWRLLVPLGMGLPLAGAAVLNANAAAVEQLPRAAVPAYEGLLHSERFLAWTWVAILFGTSSNLLSGRRSIQAAVTAGPSLDNIVELVIVSVAGLVVASALHRGWKLSVPVLPWLLVAYAVMASLSVAWSPYLLFSGARAYEFIVLALFVAYCAARAAHEEGFAERLLLGVLRPAVFIVLALALWALAQGGFSLDRFTWPRIDPSLADHPDRPRGHAALLLLPVLALLFHPARSRITRPLPWWLVVAFLLPLVHQTGSRSYTLAAVAAVVAGWAVASLRDTRVGAFGVSVALVAGGALTLTAATPVVEFLYRGQSADTVTGLNGRIELWRRVLAEPLGNEVWGIGVGAVRGGLPGHWNPPNTHSAWIEILQTLGVIGLGLMGGLVVALLISAAVRGSAHGAWMATFAVGASLTSVTISQPGFTFTVLCLAIVVVCGKRPHGQPAPG